MKLKFTTTIWIVFLFFVSACQAQTPVATAELTTPTSAYPMMPTPVNANLVYPPPVQTGGEVYPAPGQSPASSTAVPFQLNKPILPSDTQVTGTGLPGVPIMLVDVTDVGAIVSEAIIQPDGTFTFEVNNLQAGHRVGVMLANLDQTSWTIESFFDPGFNGDEAMVNPNIGFLFDTCMVR